MVSTYVCPACRVSFDPAGCRICGRRLEVPSNAPMPCNKTGETYADRYQRVLEYQVRYQTQWWYEKAGPHCPYCYRQTPVLAVDDKYECVCGAIHNPDTQSYSRHGANYGREYHRWDRSYLCEEEWIAMKKSGIKPTRIKTKNPPKTQTRRLYALMVRGRYVRGVQRYYSGGDSSGSCSFGDSAGADVALFEHPPLDFVCQGKRVRTLVVRGLAHIVEIDLPVFAVQPVEHAEEVDERLQRLENMMFGRG